MQRHFALACECAFIYLGLPVLLFFYPERGYAVACLWGVTLYAILYMRQNQNFSWPQIWRGISLNTREQLFLAGRFILATVLTIAITHFWGYGELFALPRHKPGFWLLIMLIYPVLSALPQEILFRCFFFDRYAVLFKEKLLPWASALAFGWMHIVLHNWEAPFLSTLLGLMIARTYQNHRSLRQATIEHALYGDMVFTVGLGLYFVIKRF